MESKNVVKSINELNFLWTIHDAKRIFELKDGELLTSNTITDGDMQLYLEIPPPGEIDSHVGINLKLSPDPSKDCNLLEKTNSKMKVLDFQISLLSDEDKVVFAKETGCFVELKLQKNKKNEFKQKFNGIVFAVFFKNDKENNFNERLTRNGDLNIACKIMKKKYNFHKVDASKKVDTDIEYDKELNNEAFSDVRIVVDDQVYSAHQVILAAKSPVFRSILENDEEKLVHDIEINDLNEATVKEMLRFIYTGQIENLENICVDLLAADAKYHIDSLKDVCELELVKTLTLENSVKRLLYAESLDAQNLKKKAIELIANNINEAIDLEDWSKLGSNLMTDIFRLGLKLKK